jgi:hypothetical protein
MNTKKIVQDHTHQVRADREDALQIVRVAIEAGLLRDGFPNDTTGYIGDALLAYNNGWRPDRFAEERASHIITALLREFRLERLLPIE